MFNKLRSFLKSGDSLSLSSDLFPYEDDIFYQNPYSYYKTLRSKSPFYFMTDGTCVLSKAADIKIAFDHPCLGNTPSRFSSLNSSKASRFTCASLASNIMPFLDGPRHKEQRRIIAKIFQKEVKRVTEDLSKIAESCVAKLSNPFSGVEDLGTPFALEIVCNLLGIEKDERLLQWSSFFIYLFTKIPSVEIRAEVDENLDQFRVWLRSQMNRENLPESGVIQGLKLAVKSEEMDETVALDSMILLFADGLENVDSGIGNMLYTFAEFPKQWKMLCDNPELLEQSVDEILRYESPAHYVARTCLEEFTWNGHSIRKDSSVLLLLGSANRDEDEFDRPESFDINRKSGSLSFGIGKHSCLGINLVKLELAAVLQALIARFKYIKISGQIEWQNRKGHRWLKEASFLAQERLK